jgi:hypothetical protein
MVDDDRMPATAKTARQIRPLPHARLLPADRRVESNGRNTDDIIQEMLLTTTSERQGRAIDHDQSASHGKEKAGGLFLMRLKTDLIADRYRRLSRKAREQVDCCASSPAAASMTASPR